MKIALLLCGQGRSVKTCFESIKTKILDLYDTDVYCHLWWDNNIKLNGYQSSWGNSYSVPSDLPELIKRLYCPKNILIEPPLNTDIISDIHCPSKEHQLPQLYAIHRVSNLFNWSEYDFIVKWRYDVEVINFLNLNNLHKNKFYTFSHLAKANGEIDHHIPYFFDDLGYILPNDMWKFLQIIDNYKSFNFDGDCVPETILTKSLYILNYVDRMIRFPIDQFGGKIIREHYQTKV